MPALLLPRPDVALQSWAVIACDQHTSEPAYWQETRRLVADNPSTLHMVLPEAHLGTSDIAGIHGHMADYLRRGVLVEQAPGLMLVERDVGRASPRRGLVVALDLEHYDYRAGSQALIRCTEGTDRNRLPTRIAVRQQAPLETPHIMVLIDDPQRTVIEPLFALTERTEPTAYDFELMQGGGRVRGWHVADEPTIDAAAAALLALRRGEPPMLYAMGDGNHSFAAARAVWEDMKAAGAAMDHPARFGLVELVNLHDDAMCFEPIHRLVTGVDPTALLRTLAEHFTAQGSSTRAFSAPQQWQRALAEPAPSAAQRIGYIAGADFGVVQIERPASTLTTATLHGFLDAFLQRASLQRESGAELDYIHGDDTLAKLAADRNRIGFLLPPMDKHDLFKIVRGGAAPRKTFSLGEAHEKRYYLECRRIAR